MIKRPGPISTLIIANAVIWLFIAMIMRNKTGSVLALILATSFITAGLILRKRSRG